MDKKIEIKAKTKQIFKSLFGSLEPGKCILALAGSVIAAFGLFNIHAQSGVTEGGVLGFVLLLEHWTGISPSVSSLVLNLLCYAWGWKLLGGEFMGYSLIASGGFTLFYAIFEKIGPLFPQIGELPLLAALLGALSIGIGVGLSVRSGGAQGGDDALAMSLAHLTKMNIKWMYLVTDLIVLLLSLTYIPLKRIIYSLLTVTLSGQLIGVVQNLNFGEKHEDRENRYKTAEKE